MSRFLNDKEKLRDCSRLEETTDITSKWILLKPKQNFFGYRDVTEINE